MLRDRISRSTIPPSMVGTAVIASEPCVDDHECDSVMATPPPQHTAKGGTPGSKPGRRGRARGTPCSAVRANRAVDRERQGQPWHTVRRCTRSANSRVDSPSRRLSLRVCSCAGDWEVCMSEVIDRLVAAMNAHDLDAATALIHNNYPSVQPAHPGRAFVGETKCAPTGRPCSPEYPTSTPRSHA